MLSDLKEYIHSICHIGDILWNRGWAEMNAGNMSIDVTRSVDVSQWDRTSCPIVECAVCHPVCAQHQYLITAAGARCRDLSHFPGKNILLIDVSDSLDRYTVLQGGGKGAQATSELATHLAVHAYLSEGQWTERAVLHTHPTHLIALTLLAPYNIEQTLSQLLVSIHPEILVSLPEGIGLVPYSCPGSDQLAFDTVTALKKHRVVVWEKHGCISIGDTIEQAFDLIDICDKAAEVFFLCKSTGHDVQGLREEDMRNLQKLYKPPDKSVR
jgi:rhamnulose-1-phosphate aldolase